MSDDNKIFLCLKFPMITETKGPTAISKIIKSVEGTHEKIKKKIHKNNAPVQFYHNEKLGFFSIP